MEHLKLVPTLTVSSLTLPGDKLARALELSSQLSLHKSMEGALKLVTAMRLPSLAERINQLLEVCTTG